MSGKRKDPRIVEPMERQVLERLNTGSLLARLRKLHSLHDCFEISDWTEEERLATANVIAFKNTEIWKLAYSDVKSILADREHYPRGSKAHRKKVAHSKKHR